jgi:hypothetical protein
MSNFQPYNISDALLRKEEVIDDDAVTEFIDLGELTERGARLEIFELGLFAEKSEADAFPADTEVNFSLEFSDDENFSDPDIYICNRWLQTGSVSGTDEMDARFRVPTQCPRYVRLKAETVGSTGTITAKFGFDVFG